MPGHFQGAGNNCIDHVQLALCECPADSACRMRVDRAHVDVDRTRGKGLNDASVTEPATGPPFSANTRNLSSFKSKPITLCLPRTRLTASGRPRLPSPMNPMSILDSFPWESDSRLRRHLYCDEPGSGLTADQQLRCMRAVGRLSRRMPHRKRLPRTVQRGMDLRCQTTTAEPISPGSPSRREPESCLRTRTAEKSIIRSPELAAEPPPRQSSPSSCEPASC